MRYDDYVTIINNVEISKSLKEFIQKNSYQFSDNELVYFVYKYGKDYNSKIELLNWMSTIVESVETRSIIVTALEYLTKAKELFMKYEEDYVYDLHIQDLDYPGDNEHYLSRTFKGAMDRIDAYFKYYKDIELKETNQTRYSVTKRSIKDYTSFKDFDNDEVGKCQLGPGKTAQTFDYWALRNYGANEDGTDNDPIWKDVESIEINYPNFVKDYSLISFSNFWIKKTFGLVVPLSSDSTPQSELYILPISKEIYTVAQETQTSEKNVFGFHQHIEHADVSCVNIDEVDEFTKECYELLKKVVKNQLSK
jgi:hypothetical protein